MFALVVLLFASVAPQLAVAQDVQDSMEKYAPKGCKYNIVPSTLASRAYTAYTGEIQLNDVFGMPSGVKRHVMQVSITGDSLLTLQAEVHRDTPATLTVSVYRRDVRGSRGRLLFGRQMLGSGGEDAKVFLHGKVEALELDVEFEMSTVEVAKSQVDSHVSEARCWPVRLDISLVPVARAGLHWPVSCPRQNQLPDSLETKGKVGDAAGIVVLGDEGIVQPFALQPAPSSQTVGTPTTAQPMKHFVYHFDDRPVSGFGESLWNGIVEVPPRLHRFVRFFFRVSFRFASAPLQLIIELFDMKDEPDETALKPVCSMGCLGGVPVYNGQLIDHAMPTGFRYRVWLLRAGMSEWLAAVPDGNQCMEFDLDYSIKFEQGMTPFEVGPAAWLCAATRLPSKIVQTVNTAAWKEHVDGQLIVGRSIWVRDRFSFPPEEVADMEHKIQIELSEPSIFRATTHHSDGVDVFIVLTEKGTNKRFCRAMKHPGPVPRQTIFCYLQPGSYELTFFADYPLGGLHPCGDFFAQIAVRPHASSDQTKQCIATQSDMSKLLVQSSFQLATTPSWKTIKVPIKFSDKPSIVAVWRNLVEVTQDQAAKKPYLRLVVHSDYVSSDLRFQVKFGGKYVADTQVTAHGYADMIGPLDEGAYDVEMYYISGSGAPEGTKLCSSSMVDLRLVSRTAFTNSSSLWMCSSIRVPPPDTLAPQPDEQVLIDSEYVIPEAGFHMLRLKFTERRLLRIVALAQGARFQLTLRLLGETTPIVRGTDNIQASVGPGTYVVKLTATFKSGRGQSCATFVLNMLLQPEITVPQCPWSPKVSSSDQSADDLAQAQATDHIGNLKLDLVPQAISKDVKKAPATSMWMNQVMAKDFEMELDVSSAVRVEVGLQPPFLPLELVLRRKRDNGKLEAPISVGEWAETRLLLMNSDVPKGKYVLQFLQSEKYHLQDGRTEDDMFNLCAHVTIFAEVGIASKEAINTMRSELLDLPDLLAVQPFPPSINMIGWYGKSGRQTVVGTQVYRFPESVGKSSIVLDNKAIIRLVCEPADLSNSQIDARLMQNGALVAQSDSLGQLVAEAGPGAYDLELRPHVQTSPFLVTFGIATEQRMQQDVQLLDSGASCAATFPKLMPATGFSPRGWSIGPTVIRLKPSFLEQEGQLARIPVTISSPSVLYIEVGSGLPLDLVRIAIAVPEGLWVGEQRGLRNSLDIELPSGNYYVHISQPKKTPNTIRVNRCLDFSVRISATPLNPDSVSDDAANAATVAAASGATGPMKAGRSKELDAREEEAVDAAPCFSMGTVPLPLDLSDPGGGSQSIGGPIDKDGRMLLRARVMITDMHDGRKKTYIGVGGKRLQMKVGISLGGYSKFSLADQLSLGIMNSATKTMVEPVETWSTKDGWERIYILDGDGFWMIFHHPHRERTGTACIHFGLQIETHPVADAVPMTQCSGADYVDPQSQFPQTIDLDESQRSNSIFRLSRPHLSLRQPKEGFLTSSSFTLKTKSWVAVEVGYNFYVSHAEMDIVRKTARSTAPAMVESQLDFIHGAGHKLDARLIGGDMLPAGDYVLRVADDHYPGQFAEGSSLCFPFSVDFIVVPEKAPPTVISVLPHPSVPITQGTDLVVTLRFSEPPYGSVDEVVKKISLGGVQAQVGSSYNDMTDNFAVATRRTTVQASVEEGHRVWVITFIADSMASMTTAKLEISPRLKSNETKRSYKFTSPTYTFFTAQKQPPPWFGGQQQLAAGSEQTAAGAGNSGVAQTQGSIGSVGSGVSVPTPRPSSDAGGIGGIRMEGGSSRSSASSASSSVGAVNFGGGFKREEPPPETSGVMPNIDTSVMTEPVIPEMQEWNAMEAAAPTRRRRRQSSSSSSSSSSGDECPSGMTLNADGICEAGSGSPVGYQTIVICTGLVVAAFFYFYRTPRSRQGHGQDKRRFNDIGQRTSMEELGLVQGMDMEEEDML